MSTNTAPRPNSFRQHVKAGLGLVILFLAPWFWQIALFSVFSSPAAAVLLVVMVVACIGIGLFVVIVACCANQQFPDHLVLPLQITAALGFLVDVAGVQMKFGSWAG